jgi:hypothetical protein
MSKETQVLIQPDNPISVLKLIEPKDCEKFGQLTASLVHEGHISAVEVEVLVKAWDKAFEGLRKAIRDNVNSEGEKYGENQKFSLMGGEYAYTTVNTQYDYKVCDDPIWNELEQAKKDREAFLKTLKAPMDVRVNDELVTIKPPLKKSTMGIKSMSK